MILVTTYSARLIENLKYVLYIFNISKKVKIVMKTNKFVTYYYIPFVDYGM